MPELAGFAVILLLSLAFGMTRAGWSATNSSFTSSTTTGTGTSLDAASQGLAQFLTGAAISAVFTKLSNGTGLSATAAGATAGTTVAVTVQTFTTFGPATIPIGANVAVCNGAPTAWPPGGNCTIEPGATLFTVNAGTVNFNSNTHTQTNTVLGANSPLFGFVLGDFHPSFQTALLDFNWNFLDALFGGLRGFGANGAANALLPGGQFASFALGDGPEGRLQLAERGPDGRMRPSPWTVWARPHGTLGKVDGSAERLGFRYDVAGVTAGAEYRFAGPWLAGASLGYAHVSVSQAATGDTGQIDSLQLGAYCGYRDRWTHVLVAALFTQNWIGSERLTTLAPSIATARYSAQSYTVGVEAGRKYPVMGNWIQPFASLIFSHLRTGSFAESGSTALEINGDASGVNALKLSLGARVWRDFDLFGATLTPEFRARWVQDLLNERRTLTGRFVGDPAQTVFAVTGAKPTPAAAILGAGLTLRGGRRFKASLGYDAELRANATAHTIQATLKLTW